MAVNGASEPPGERNQKRKLNESGSAADSSNERDVCRKTERSDLLKENFDKVSYQIEVLAHLPISSSIFQKHAVRIISLCAAEDGPTRDDNTAETLLGWLKDAGADQERTNAARSIFQREINTHLLKQIGARLDNEKEVLNSIRTLLVATGERHPSLKDNLQTIDAAVQQCLARHNSTLQTPVDSPMPDLVPFAFDNSVTEPTGKTSTIPSKASTPSKPPSNTPEAQSTKPASNTPAAQHDTPRKTVQYARRTPAPSLRIVSGGSKGDKKTSPTNAIQERLAKQEQPAPLETTSADLPRNSKLEQTLPTSVTQGPSAKAKEATRKGSTSNVNLDSIEQLIAEEVNRATAMTAAATESTPTVKAKVESQSKVTLQGSKTEPSRPKVDPRASPGEFHSRHMYESYRPSDYRPTERRLSDHRPSDYRASRPNESREGDYYRPGESRRSIDHASIKRVLADRMEQGSVGAPTGPRNLSHLEPKDMTCWFWFCRGSCSRSDDDCHYKHTLADYLAEMGSGFSRPLKIIVMPTLDETREATLATSRVPRNRIPEVVRKDDERDRSDNAQEWGSETPIVDALWGKRPISFEQRYRISNTIIDSIRDRRHLTSQDFVTSLPCGLKSPIDYSLTGPGGLTSKLGGILAQKHYSGPRMRILIEQCLKPFVVANKGKFLELPPNAFRD